MTGAARAAIAFFLRWLKRGLAVLVGLLLLYQVWLFGWVVLWNWVDPDMTSFMEIRLAELQVKQPRAQLEKRWLDYPRISPHLKRALIVAEDDLFTQHDGFDWDGIQRAMEKNMRRGKIVAGGSTISQQLARITSYNVCYTKLLRQRSVPV